MDYGADVRFVSQGRDLSLSAVYMFCKIAASSDNHVRDMCLAVVPCETENSRKTKTLVRGHCCRCLCVRVRPNLFPLISHRHKKRIVFFFNFVSDNSQKVFVAMRF